MVQAPVNATLLNAVAATGLGNPVIFRAVRSNHSFQVKSTGSPTAVKVYLWGTMDLTNYGLLGTWDTAAGQTDGDIMSVNGVNVIAVKGELVTLTAGTAPTVTMTYSGKP